MMIHPVVLFMLTLGMGLQPGGLDQLARNGNIQESARVKASSEITINAPPESVWRLLTGVKDWPKWQPDITGTEVRGPIERGTEFSWTNGTRIRSRVALVQPSTKFVWTGSVFLAKAIHVWELERLPANRTLVRTKESMDGPLLTIFFSSRQLAESHHRWLMALKTAAER